MLYLKIASVFAVTWILWVQSGFTPGQSWLLAMLATAVALVIFALSDLPPKPYLLWFTPNWEAIQASHRIASEHQFRAWLDRATEVELADDPDAEPDSRALTSPATEQQLFEARVTNRGLGVQWLHQNLFRISDYETFSSKLDWEIFLEVSHDEPKNTLVFRCKWGLDGYQISVAPEHSRYYIDSSSYVGEQVLATLPHDLFNRIRYRRAALRSRFFRRHLSRLGWNSPTDNRQHLRDIVIELEHRYLRFTAYEL